MTVNSIEPLIVTGYSWIPFFKGMTQPRVDFSGFQRFDIVNETRKNVSIE